MPTPSAPRHPANTSSDRDSGTPRNGTTHATRRDVYKRQVFNCPIVNVTFDAGCRNNWHRHPGGQILLCTAGEGRYQQRGTPPVILKPGDIVKIAPDIEHWHGAAPDTPFTHIAIETRPEAGPAVWLEPVTDDDYRATPVPLTTPGTP